MSCAQDLRLQVLHDVLELSPDRKDTKRTGKERVTEYQYFIDDIEVRNVGGRFLSLVTSPLPLTVGTDLSVPEGSQGGVVVSQRRLHSSRL